MTRLTSAHPSPRPSKTGTMGVVGKPLALPLRLLPLVSVMLLEQIPIRFSEAYLVQHQHYAVGGGDSHGSAASGQSDSDIQEPKFKKFKKKTSTTSSEASSLPPFPPSTGGARSTFFLQQEEETSTRVETDELQQQNKGRASTFSETGGTHEGEDEEDEDAHNFGKTYYPTVIVEDVAIGLQQLAADSSLLLSRHSVDINQVLVPRTPLNALTNFATNIGMVDEKGQPTEAAIIGAAGAVGLGTMGAAAVGMGITAFPLTLAQSSASVAAYGAATAAAGAGAYTLLQGGLYDLNLGYLTEKVLVPVTTSVELMDCPERMELQKMSYTVRRWLDASSGVSANEPSWINKGKLWWPQWNSKVKGDLRASIFDEIDTGTGALVETMTRLVQDKERVLKQSKTTLEKIYYGYGMNEKHCKRRYELAAVSANREFFDPWNRHLGRPGEEGMLLRKYHLISTADVDIKSPGEGPLHQLRIGRHTLHKQLRGEMGYSVMFEDGVGDIEGGKKAKKYRNLKAGDPGGISLLPLEPEGTHMEDGTARVRMVLHYFYQYRLLFPESWGSFVFFGDTNQLAECKEMLRLTYSRIDLSSDYSAYSSPVVAFCALRQVGSTHMKALLTKQGVRPGGEASGAVRRRKKPSEYIADYAKDIEFLSVKDSNMRRPCTTGINDDYEDCRNLGTPTTRSSPRKKQNNKEGEVDNSGGTSAGKTDGAPSSSASKDDASGTSNSKSFLSLFTGTSTSSSSSSDDASGTSTASPNADLADSSIAQAQQLNPASERAKKVVDDVNTVYFSLLPAQLGGNGAPPEESAWNTYKKGSLNSARKSAKARQAAQIDMESEKAAGMFVNGPQARYEYVVEADNDSKYLAIFQQDSMGTWRERWNPISRHASRRIWSDGTTEVPVDDDATAEQQLKDQPEFLADEVEPSEDEKAHKQLNSEMENAFEDQAEANRRRARLPRNRFFVYMDYEDLHRQLAEAGWIAWGDSSLTGHLWSVEDPDHGRYSDNSMEGRPDAGSQKFTHLPTRVDLAGQADDMEDLIFGPVVWPWADYLPALQDANGMDTKVAALYSPTSQGFATVPGMPGAATGGGYNAGVPLTNFPTGTPATGVLPGGAYDPFHGQSARLGQPAGRFGAGSAAVSSGGSGAFAATTRAPQTAADVYFKTLPKRTLDFIGLGGAVPLSLAGDTTPEEDAGAAANEGSSKTSTTPAKKGKISTWEVVHKPDHSVSMAYSIFEDEADDDLKKEAIYVELVNSQSDDAAEIDHIEAMDWRSEAYKLLKCGKTFLNNVAEAIVVNAAESVMISCAKIDRDRRVFDAARLLERIYLKLDLVTSGAHILEHSLRARADSMAGSSNVAKDLKMESNQAVPALQLSRFLKSKERTEGAKETTTGSTASAKEVADAATPKKDTTASATEPRPTTATTSFLQDDEESGKHAAGEDNMKSVHLHKKHENEKSRSRSSSSTSSFFENVVLPEDAESSERMLLRELCEDDSDHAFRGEPGSFDYLDKINGKESARPYKIPGVSGIFFDRLWGNKLIFADAIKTNCYRTVLEYVRAGHFLAGVLEEQHRREAQGQLLGNGDLLDQKTGPLSPHAALEAFDVGLLFAAAHLEKLLMLENKMYLRQDLEERLIEEHRIVDTTLDEVRQTIRLKVFGEHYLDFGEMMRLRYHMDRFRYRMTKRSVERSSALRQELVKREKLYETLDDSLLKTYVLTGRSRTSFAYDSPGMRKGRGVRRHSKTGASGTEQDAEAADRASFLDVEYYFSQQEQLHASASSQSDEEAQQNRIKETWGELDTYKAMGVNVLEINQNTEDASEHAFAMHHGCYILTDVGREIYKELIPQMDLVEQYIEAGEIEAENSMKNDEKGEHLYVDPNTGELQEVGLELSDDEDDDEAGGSGSGRRRGIANEEEELNLDLDLDGEEVSGRRQRRGPERGYDRLLSSHQRGGSTGGDGGPRGSDGYRRGGQNEDDSGYMNQFQRANQQFDERIAELQAQAAALERFPNDPRKKKDAMEIRKQIDRLSKEQLSANFALGNLGDRSNAQTGVMTGTAAKVAAESVQERKHKVNLDTALRGPEANMQQPRLEVVGGMGAHLLHPPKADPEALHGEELVQPEVTHLPANYGGGAGVEQGLPSSSSSSAKQEQKPDPDSKGRSGDASAAIGADGTVANSPSAATGEQPKQETSNQPSTPPAPSTKGAAAGKRASAFLQVGQQQRRVGTTRKRQMMKRTSKQTRQRRQAQQVQVGGQLPGVTVTDPNAPLHPAQFEAAKKAGYNLDMIHHANFRPDPRVQKMMRISKQKHAAEAAGADGIYGAGASDDPSKHIHDLWREQKKIRAAKRKALRAQRKKQRRSLLPFEAESTTYGIPPQIAHLHRVRMTFNPAPQLLFAPGSMELVGKGSFGNADSTIVPFSKLAAAEADPAKNQVSHSVSEYYVEMRLGAWLNRERAKEMPHYTTMMLKMAQKFYERWDSNCRRISKVYAVESPNKPLPFACSGKRLEEISFRVNHLAGELRMMLGAKDMDDGRAGVMQRFIPVPEEAPTLVISDNSQRQVAEYQDMAVLYKMMAIPGELRPIFRDPVLQQYIEAHAKEGGTFMGTPLMLTAAGAFGGVPPPGGQQGPRGFRGPPAIGARPGRLPATSSSSFLATEQDQSQSQEESVGAVLGEMMKKESSSTTSTSSKSERLVEEEASTTSSTGGAPSTSGRSSRKEPASSSFAQEQFPPADVQDAITASTSTSTAEAESPVEMSEDEAVFALGMTNWTLPASARFLYLEQEYLSSQPYRQEVTRDLDWFNNIPHGGRFEAQMFELMLKTDRGDPVCNQFNQAWQQYASQRFEMLAASKDRDGLQSGGEEFDQWKERFDKNHGAANSQLAQIVAALLASWDSKPDYSVAIVLPLLNEDPDAWMEVASVNCLIRSFEKLSRLHAKYKNWRRRLGIYFTGSMVFDYSPTEYIEESKEEIAEMLRDGSGYGEEPGKVTTETTKEDSSCCGGEEDPSDDEVVGEAEPYFPSAGGSSFAQDGGMPAPPEDQQFEPTSISGLAPDATIGEENGEGGGCCGFGAEEKPQAATITADGTIETAGGTADAGATGAIGDDAEDGADKDNNDGSCGSSSCDGLGTNQDDDVPTLPDFSPTSEQNYVKRHQYRVRFFPTYQRGKLHIQAATAPPEWMQEYPDGRLLADSEDYDGSDAGAAISGATRDLYAQRMARARNAGVGAAEASTHTALLSTAGIRDAYLDGDSVEYGLRVHGRQVVEQYVRKSMHRFVAKARELEMRRMTAFVHPNVKENGDSCDSSSCAGGACSESCGSSDDSLEDQPEDDGMINNSKSGATSSAVVQQHGGSEESENQGSGCCGGDDDEEKDDENAAPGRAGRATPSTSSFLDKTKTSKKTTTTSAPNAIETGLDLAPPRTRYGGGDDKLPIYLTPDEEEAAGMSTIRKILHGIDRRKQRSNVLKAKGLLAMFQARRRLTAYGQHISSADHGALWELNQPAPAPADAEVPEEAAVNTGASSSTAATSAQKTPAATTAPAAPSETTTVPAATTPSAASAFLEVNRNKRKKAVLVSPSAANAQVDPALAGLNLPMPVAEEPKVVHTQVAQQDTEIDLAEFHRVHPQRTIVDVLNAAADLNTRHLAEMAGIDLSEGAMRRANGWVNYFSQDYFANLQNYMPTEYAQTIEREQNRFAVRLALGQTHTLTKKDVSSRRTTSAKMALADAMSATIATGDPRGFLHHYQGQESASNSLDPGFPLGYNVATMQQSRTSSGPGSLPPPALAARTRMHDATASVEELVERARMGAIGSAAPVNDGAMFATSDSEEDRLGQEEKKNQYRFLPRPKRWANAHQQVGDAALSRAGMQLASGPGMHMAGASSFLTGIVRKYASGGGRDIFGRMSDMISRGLQGLFQKNYSYSVWPPSYSSSSAGGTIASPSAGRASSSSTSFLDTSSSSSTAASTGKEQDLQSTRKVTVEEVSEDENNMNNVAEDSSFGRKTSTSSRKTTTSTRRGAPKMKVFVSNEDGNMVSASQFLQRTKTSRTGRERRQQVQGPRLQTGRGKNEGTQILTPEEMLILNNNMEPLPPSQSDIPGVIPPPAPGAPKASSDRGRPTHLLIPHTPAESFGFELSDVRDHEDLKKLEIKHGLFHYHRGFFDYTLNADAMQETQEYLKMVQTWEDPAPENALSIWEDFTHYFHQ
ncbi:unnamed protein product [Amoebophrya sp. A25]|nr:unnamed protein product [Amoebophrya sp. A25]|eukprot:GSA25T00004056001.1